MLGIVWKNVHVCIPCWVEVPINKVKCYPTMTKKLSTGPRPKVLEGGLSGMGELDRPLKLSTGPSMPPDGPRPRPPPEGFEGLEPTSGAGDWDRPRRLSTGPRPRRPPPPGGRFFSEGGALPFNISTGPSPKFLELSSGAGGPKLSTGPSISEPF